MRSHRYENEFLFSCNETHYHKKGLELSLVLKVGVFGTQKLPFSLSFHYVKLYPSLTPTWLKYE